MNSPRIVRCPSCGGPSVYAPDNAYRPFCSHRCRTADLGAWASEQYRVASATPLGDDSSDEDGPADAPTSH